MDNPILNLYKIRYQIDREPQVRVKYFACVGGWSAANDVAESVLAYIGQAIDTCREDDRTTTAKLVSIRLISPCLSVDKDLLKDIRDAAGADEEKAGEFIDPLAEFALLG